MLRFALRRVLWLVPTLFATTVVAFAVLSGAAARVTPGQATLPRFLNLSPRGAQDRATQAMQVIAEGGAGAAAAETTLVEMGGAALPHVLPRLDALSPADRTRVALALSPLARRMGLAAEEEASNRETAALFWSRYWQDHAIDFRPAVVKRAVRRAAERPSALRVAEVLSFDTFALPELVAAMRSETDVTRLRRLFALASRLSPVAWTVPETATKDEARAVVDRWEQWWIQNRGLYVPFQGTARVAAMVRETQYGTWVSQLAAGTLGRTEDGSSVSRALAAGAPTTLWLVAVALFGGYAAGTALGLISVLSSRPVDRAISLSCVLLAAIPAAVLAAAAAPDGLTAGAALAGSLLMLVLAAPAVERRARTSGIDVASRRRLYAARAFGKPRRFAAAALARPVTSTALGLMTADLPYVVTAAFVVEHALGLNGIGTAALRAVRAADVTFLMAFVLLSTVAVALLNIAVEATMASLDRRLAPALGAFREDIP